MRNRNDYLTQETSIEPKIIMFDNLIAQQQIEDTEFEDIDVEELCQDVLDLIAQSDVMYKDWNKKRIAFPEILEISHEDPAIPFRGPTKEETKLIIVCLSNSWSPWHGGAVTFYDMSEVCEIVHPIPGRVLCIESESWMQIQPPNTSADEKLLYLKFFVK